MARAELSWDDQSSVTSSASVGGTTATWNFTASDTIGTASQVVTGIDTGVGTIDTTSNINLIGASVSTITFAQPVTNLEFRVNDFEAASEFFRLISTNGGSAVSYTATLGSETVLSSGSTASGDATFSSLSTSGSNNPDDPDGSILIQIAGPVDKLSIDLTGTASSYTLDLSDLWFDVLCFVDGTMIDTFNGPVAVEKLQPNDLVRTRDNGYRPIRWISHTEIDDKMFGVNEKLYPIRITAGACGAGLPTKDLLVSRQHRVLVSSKIAERVTGVTDVLISANKLVGIPGIYVDTSFRDLRYYHLLFDAHEIIYSENAPTESLLPGAQALSFLSTQDKAEISKVLPDAVDPAITWESSVKIPSLKEQREIAGRHIKNRKDLVEREPTVKLVA